jgi:hypothetical protein
MQFDATHICKGGGKIEQRESNTTARTPTSLRIPVAGVCTGNVG